MNFIIKFKKVKVAALRQENVPKKRA